MSKPVKIILICLGSFLTGIIAMLIDKDNIVYWGKTFSGSANYSGRVIGTAIYIYFFSFLWQMCRNRFKYIKSKKISKPIKIILICLSIILLIYLGLALSIQLIFTPERLFIILAIFFVAYAKKIWNYGKKID